MESTRKMITLVGNDTVTTISIVRRRIPFTVSHHSLPALLPHFSGVHNSIDTPSRETLLDRLLANVTSVSGMSRSATMPFWLWSLRIFPSLPGSRLTNFYRDAGSALLQLVS